MKTLSFNKKLILTILTALSLLAFAFFGFNFAISKADGQSPNNVTVNVYSPSTVEYKKLISPSDVFYFNDSYAIIHNNQNELLFFNSTTCKYEIVDTGLTNLKQVNKVDDNTLIVLGNTSPTLVKIDLTTKQKTTLSFSGNFFDVVGNNIVTVFNTNLSLYVDETLDTNFSKSDAKGDFPVKVNANGDIFYVNSSDKLMKTDLTCAVSTEICADSPSVFCVNEQYLFYYFDGELHRITLETNIDQKVNFPESQFDLGKFSQISSICFKGDNLLITDSSLNAIQEFEITESGNELSLKFTGFAIAKDLTAFNRISNTVKEIEKLNDTTAVLDQNKILLEINNSNGKIYKNYTFSDSLEKIDQNTFNINCLAPESFALGKASALLYKNEASTTTTFVLDFETGELQTIGGLNQNKITDVCYEGGTYYLLTQGNNNETSIYRLAEGEYVASVLDNTLPSLTNGTLNANPLLTVDIYGNVFATDRINDKIIKFTLDKTTNEYVPSLLQVSATNVIKLQTDLNGDIFVLYNDNTAKHVTASTVNDISLTATNTEGESKKIISFCMDYVDGVVNFITENDELIFESSSLNNVSVLTLSDEVLNKYVTNGQNAKALDQTNYYTFNSKAPSIAITINETDISYLRTLDLTEDVTFVEIDSFVKSEQTYRILSGIISDKVYVLLINALGTTEKTDIIADSLNSKAYVSTEVDMYYLPIIDRNQTYCLTDGTSVIRLASKTEIAVSKVVTFAGRDFYYATATIDDSEITGYVPVGFTTLELTEAVTPSTFTVEKVDKTVLYSDTGLTNQVITLKQGSVVKVFKIENGVAKISFTDTDGTVYEGYISTNSIIKVTNNTIRNVLIIFCVLVCVTISSLYFVRKIKK